MEPVKSVMCDELAALGILGNVYNFDFVIISAIDEWAYYPNLTGICFIPNSLLSRR